MRIRSVKPEFWTSESMSRVSRDARLLFIGLWNLADDEGRLRGNPLLLAGTLFPCDEDARRVLDESSTSPRRILLEVWLDELVKENAIRRYWAEGNAYIDIPNWLRHQRIDRPSKSKIPEFDESSTSPRRVLDESSRKKLLDQGSGNGNGNGNGAGNGKGPGNPPAPTVAATAKVSTKPKPTGFKAWTLDEFIASIEADHNSHLDPEETKRFINYWSEKSNTGRMRFSLLDTWETPKRLANWASRAQKQASKDKVLGVYYLPPGTPTIKQKPIGA